MSHTLQQQLSKRNKFLIQRAAAEDKTHLSPFAPEHSHVSRFSCAASKEVGSSWSQEQPVAAMRLPVAGSVHSGHTSLPLHTAAPSPNLTSDQQSLGLSGLLSSVVTSRACVKLRLQCAPLSHHRSSACRHLS